MEKLELNEIKARNEKVFVNYFEKVFGKDFLVECDWGFPTLVLKIGSDKNNKRNQWNFGINVTSREFSLKTYGAKLENEVWIPDNASIDSKTLNFILDSVVNLSNRIFGLNASETTNSEETKKVE